MEVLIACVDHSPGKEWGYTRHCETVAKHLEEAFRSAIPHCALSYLPQPSLDSLREKMTELCTHTILADSDTDSNSDNSSSSPKRVVQTSTENAILVFLSSGSLDSISTDDGTTTLSELSEICPNVVVDLHRSAAEVLINTSTSLHVSKMSSFAYVARSFVRFLMEVPLLSEEKSSAQLLLRKFATWCESIGSVTMRRQEKQPRGPYKAVSVYVWAPADLSEEKATPRPSSRANTPSVGKKQSQRICTQCMAKGTDVPLLVCTMCQKYVVCGDCYKPNEHEHQLFKRVEPSAQPRRPVHSASQSHRTNVHKFSASAWYQKGCQHKNCGGETKTAAILFDSYLAFLRRQLMEDGDATAESLPPGQTLEVPESISDHLSQYYFAYTQGAFRTNRAARFICVDERSTENLFSFFNNVKCFRSVSCGLRARAVDVRIADAVEAVQMFREVDPTWIIGACHEASIVVHVPEILASQLILGMFDLRHDGWEVMTTNPGYPESIQHMEYHCSKHRGVVRHATELVMRPSGGKQCVPYWPCVCLNKNPPDSSQKVLVDMPSTRSRPVNRATVGPHILEAKWTISLHTEPQRYKWSDDEHLKKYQSKWVQKFPGKSRQTQSLSGPKNFSLGVDIKIERLLGARRLFLKMPGRDISPREMVCANCSETIFIPAHRVATVGTVGSPMYTSFLFSISMMCDDSNLAISSSEGITELLQLLAPFPTKHPRECSFVMFLVACLVRTKDLPRIRTLREKYNAWAAPRIQSSDHQTMWFDPAGFLRNWVPDDPLMKTLQQTTLSMAGGRDLFPAVLLASLPRIQQVHLHRGVPDCSFFIHGDCVAAKRIEERALQKENTKESQGIEKLRQAEHKRHLEDEPPVVVEQKPFEVRTATAAQSEEAQKFAYSDSSDVESVKVEEVAAEAQIRNE